jgi:chromosome segregation ATPase
MNANGFARVSSCGVAPPVTGGAQATCAGSTDRIRLQRAAAAGAEIFKKSESINHQTTPTHMKATKLTTLVSYLGLAALLAAVSACKTEQYAGESTAANLQASGTQIEGIKDKLDAATTSLNGMVNTPTNLPEQFSVYTAAVKDLDATGTDAKAKVAAAREKGNAFFQNWDARTAQIKNEDIKKHSQERKKEVMERFTKIKGSFQQVFDSYQPLMSNLKDIQSALSTDLTTGGVASVKGAADSANKDAEGVKKGLDELATEFKDLGAAMSSMGAAAAAASSTNAPPAATK